MNGVSVLASAGFLLTSITPALAQAPGPRAIAFVNVNLIAMSRDGVDPGQTVVVQGDRIVAMGRSTPPADAIVVDGTGRYLLPGLTDSHVHITTDMPWAPARADFGDAPLYLAHGVTTVVNLRGTPAQLDWKRRIAAGGLLAPTIYTSGEFVNEPRVTTPDEVQREVDAQAAAGYDLIKFHEIMDPAVGLLTGTGLSRASYLRMFEAARARDLPVVGHAPVNLGVDGLLASSGGAVAHIGELVRLNFRPPLRVLLVDVAATLVLLLTAAGWGLGALVRRRRGALPASAALTQAKVLAASVPVAFLVTFVAGTLAGVGGQFFDSASWRGAFAALACGFVALSLVTIRTGVRAAIGRSVPMASRVPLLAATLVTAVLAFTTIFYLLPSIWRGGESGRASIASRLREAGISVQTTLIVYDVGFGGRDATARVLSDPAFAALTPQAQALWRRLADRTPPGLLMRLVEAPPRYAEFTRAIAASLHRNGVPLLAGTDAMGLPLILPGSALLRELHLLGQAGLTTYDVIRTATVNPATFLGKADEFGSIAVGKRADLLLLERNPLEDLSALHQPIGVMVRGRWLPWEELRALVSRLN